MQTVPSIYKKTSILTKYYTDIKDSENVFSETNIDLKRKQSTHVDPKSPQSPMKHLISEDFVGISEPNLHSQENKTAMGDDDHKLGSLTQSHVMLLSPSSLSGIQFGSLQTEGMNFLNSESPDKKRKPNTYSKSIQTPQQENKSGVENQLSFSPNNTLDIPAVPRRRTFVLNSSSQIVMNPIWPSNNNSIIDVDFDKSISKNENIKSDKE